MITGPVLCSPYSMCRGTRRIAGAGGYVEVLEGARGVTDELAGTGGSVAGLATIPASFQHCEKIRPAWHVCVESAIFFAQRAKNGPKWLIFAVLGEFCRGEWLSTGALGEFFRGACPGGGLLGVFSRGISLQVSPARPAPDSAPRARLETWGPHPPAPHGQPSPGLVSTCLPLAREGEVHEEQVQRHDDGRDEEAGDAQGACVCVIAHDIG